MSSKIFEEEGFLIENNNKQIHAYQKSNLFIIF